MVNGPFEFDGKCENPYASRLSLSEDPLNLDSPSKFFPKVVRYDARDLLNSDDSGLLIGELSDASTELDDTWGEITANQQEYFSKQDYARFRKDEEDRSQRLSRILRGEMAPHSLTTPPQEEESET